MSSKKLVSGRSIRHRFTYTLVGVVTGILLIFSVAIILYNVNTIEEELERRLEDASELAVLSLPSALWQYNYEYVEDFVESIFLDENIILVKMMAGGEIVDEKYRPGFPQKDFAWFRKSPDFMVKEIGIIYEGHPVGKIGIAVTRQRIKKAIITNSVVSIILLVAIAAAISITLFFITRRYIFRPLSRLEGSAELISGGDLDAPIDTSANDEIGNLAGSFEQMIKNLKKITTSRDKLDNEVKERKQAEEALRKEKDRAQNYLDIAGVIFVAIKSDGEVTLINKKGCEILGYDESEIIGKNWFENFLPERIRTEITPVSKKLLSDEIEAAEYYENPILTSRGQERLIAWHNSALRDDGGNIIGHLSSGEDISERRLAEDQIKASLDEKEVLLKEIHHRVKNNMQVITSLLSLQSDIIKDQQHADMFRESQERIRAMALIHEKLYRSRDLARVDFNEYIKSLVNGLFRSHGIDTGRIVMKVKVEDVSLGIDHAIPCGLVINELVSNALKYAFPEDRKGEISVTLRSISEDEIELRVSDDGVGIPEDMDIGSTDSLGLELVTILTEDQLEGKINLDRTGGTTFRILFKRL